MIRYPNGSIFDSGAVALVNPVNCRGAMGKGLALAFAKRWPELLPPYRSACASGDLRIGTVLVLDVDDLLTKHVVCVPTKNDWRDRSSIADVMAGLKALAQVAHDRCFDSLAVPALGCGLGGLEWGAVRPLVEMTLMSLNCDVMVYRPEGTR